MLVATYRDAASLIIGGNSFAGSLGELRIWNSALNASEIASRYDKSFSDAFVISRPDLVSYFRFEDGAGSSIVTNAVNPSRHGNVTGTPVFAAMAPARSTFSATELASVRSLTSNSRISNLAGIERLTNLTTLNLARTSPTSGVDNADLAALVPMRLTSGPQAGEIVGNANLTSLNLTNQLAVTDITSLGVLTKLQSLRLEGTGVTASSASTRTALVAMPELTTLMLPSALLPSNTNLVFSEGMNVSIATLPTSTSQPSLDFDGANDYVALGAVTALANLTQNFTVAAWIKTDNVTSFVKHGIIGGGSWTFATERNQLVFTARTIQDYRTTLAPIVVGQWIHVAAVVKPTAIEFYVNGVFLESVPSTVAGIVRAGDFVIGALAPAGELWDGRLSDIGVWNAALTPSQIAEIRLANLAPMSSSQIAYLRLKEGAGLTVSSLGPTVINGTLTNGPVWANDYPGHWSVAGNTNASGLGTNVTFVPTDSGIHTVSIGTLSFPMVVRNVAPIITQIPDLALANANAGVREGQTISFVANASAGRFDVRVDGANVDQLIVTDPSSADLAQMNVKISIEKPDGTTVDLAQRSLQFGIVGTPNVSLPREALHQATNLTSAFWLRTTKTGLQTLISAANATSLDEFSMSLNNRNTWTVHFHNQAFTWTTSTLADQFYHVAIVRDLQRGIAELFLDGVSQGTRTLAGTQLPLSIDRNGLILGQDQDVVGGGFQSAEALVGFMDDFTLWNRALTVSEVNALRNNLVADSQGDLRVRLKLNELTGTTALDNSVNGLDGLVTLPIWSSTVPSVFPVQYTVPDNGIYKLLVQVVDKDGAGANAERSFTVANQNPTITNLNQGTIPIEINRPITFSAANVVDPGANDTRTFLWEVATNNGQRILSSDQFHYSITPLYAGFYSVTLTVTDNDGGSTSLTNTFEVNPIAVITAPANSPQAGSVVTLRSANSSPLAPAGGLIGTSLIGQRNYDWAVSLGSTIIKTGSSADLNFVPLVAGMYTATLIVTDDYDKSDFFSHSTSTSFNVTAPAVVTINSENDVTAADFDGLDDQIHLGLVPALTALRNNLTVAAWIKPDSLSGIQRILSGGNWGFGLNNAGLRFTTYSVRDYNINTSLLTVGLWNHVAATMRADNSVEFFINGVSIGTVAGSSQANTTAGNFSIGSASFGERFNGMLSDVGAWSGVLTQPQLNQIRSGDIAGTNPVGFWRLNEGQGVTVSSSGATAINGTLTNGLGWASHVNATEGDTLNFSLANLAPIGELGTRLVQWTVTPSTFEVLGPDTRTIANKVLTSNVATIITSGSDHVFKAGDSVVVSIADTVFDGEYVVLAVPAPTPNSFSYSRINSNIVSTAVANGSVGRKPTGETLAIRVTSDSQFQIKATITDTITSPTNAFPTAFFVRTANTSYSTVSNSAPNITVNDVTGSENVPAAIVARVADSGVYDTHTFSITWSDGSANSTGSVEAGLISVAKTFAQDGIYAGALTVTDNQGASRVQFISIVIANTAPTANNDAILLPTIVAPETIGNSAAVAYTVSDLDLVSGIAAVVSGGAITPSEGSSSSTLTLTDGTFGIARSTSPNGYPDAFLATNNRQWTFNLDTASSPSGYDISSIDTYTGWRDNGRDNQNYILRYSTVDNPTSFITLTTVNYAPTPNSPSSSRVTVSGGSGFLASRVAAVRFEFTNVENGYVGYREIDVFGVPSFGENNAIVIPNDRFTSNDTDPSPMDQASLFVSSVQAMSTMGATITRNPDGSVFYNPNTSDSLNALRIGQTATDTFIYVVSDSSNASSTATMSIVVSGVNDLPVAVVDIGAISEDAIPTFITGNLISNDSDVDSGTALTIALVNGSTAPTVAGLYGSLVWNADGSYTYSLNNSLPVVQQLAAGQSLTESFTYMLSDGVASVPSSLTINITGANDAPIAAANSNTVTADSMIRIESGGYDDSILVDAPVAYWRLSEFEGTVAANRMAPTTPDGTINGTIRFLQQGLLANSSDTGLLFNGAQSISVASSPLINSYSGNATAKTIELWFSAPNVQTRQVLYEQGGTLNGLNLYIDAGQLYFGTWNANVFGPTVKTDITGNTTYHVVAVFGASTATLYVNGVQVATEATSFSGIASHGAPTMGGASTTRFHDSIVTSASSHNLVGTLDEVSLYNTSLTAAQIGRHYAATGLIAGDTDVDSGDTRAVTAVNSVAGNVGKQFVLPSGALLTLHADGSYDYDPNGSFDSLPEGMPGTDTFTYTVTDSAGATSTASVTVTVIGKNDAPSRVMLSGNQVTDSSVVGNFNTIDIDVADSHTYAILNSGPLNPFTIDGSRLLITNRTGLTLNETRIVTIAVTDSLGATLRQAFPVVITSLVGSNNPPTDIILNPSMVLENTPHSR